MTIPNQPDTTSAMDYQDKMREAGQLALSPSLNLAAAYPLQVNPVTGVFIVAQALDNGRIDPKGDHEGGIEMILLATLVGTLRDLKVRVSRHPTGFDAQAAEKRLLALAEQEGRRTDIQGALNQLGKLPPESRHRSLWWMDMAGQSEMFRKLANFALIQDKFFAAPEDRMTALYTGIATCTRSLDEGRIQFQDPRALEAVIAVLKAAMDLVPDLGPLTKSGAMH